MINLHSILLKKRFQSKLFSYIFKISKEKIKKRDKRSTAEREKSGSSLSIVALIDAVLR